MKERTRLEQSLNQVRGIEQDLDDAIEMIALAEAEGEGEMVADAEASKEADAKRREAIDLKNEADQCVYNTEKQLQEHSAKIP